MICFAGALQYSVPATSGLTLGVVNTLNMLGGAFIQQVIGWYLDAHWQGKYGSDGARSYGQEELSSSFFILVFIMVSCIFMIFLLPRKSSLSSKQASETV